jgi:hypothetical protein
MGKGRESRIEDGESKSENSEFRIVYRDPRFSPKVTTVNETRAFVYSVIPADVGIQVS